MRTAGMPGKGEDVRVESLGYLPGGSAANCAVAAARLEIATYFLGNVGKDLFGQMILRDLRAAKVNTAHLHQMEGDSGTVTSILTPDGERTFFSYRGVNTLEYNGIYPQRLFEQAAFLHLTGYSFQDPGSRQSALALMSLAQQAGVAISLDPSFGFVQAWGEDRRKVLSSLALFTPNLAEAVLLTGAQEPEMAALALLKLGPKRVILKLGTEGCLLADQAGIVAVPGFQASRVVDTTGAGDAFCAGFLAGQIWGLSARESAVIGNLAAAGVVEGLGGHSTAIEKETLCKQLDFHHCEQINQKIIQHQQMN